MRKIAVFSVILAISFILGCSFQNDTQKVVNKSSKKVYYTMFHEHGKFELDSGKTRNHEVPFNSHQGPTLVSVDTPPFDVEMIRIDSLTYEFADISAIDLHIANTLSVDVTISTGDIEYMSQPAITIPKNSDDSSHKIFTKNPKFFILSNFPAIIDWNYKDAVIEKDGTISENETIYVIIR